MLSLVILDDEKDMLIKHENKFTDLLDRYSVNGEIVLATTDHEKFMQIIEKGKANVCIIDIDLRCNENGMNIARRIREINYGIKIIFFTGFFEYAQLSYEVGAYWFIHKPDWDMLERALIKLNMEMQLQKPTLVCIECNTGDAEEFGNNFILFNSINYIDRYNDRTCVHTDKNRYGKDSYLTKVGIESLASKINDKRLQRCHRSIFVNIEKIQHINLKCTSITLQDGTKCDIGPNYRNYFRNWRPL